jgi:hypothetical protein
MAVQISMTKTNVNSKPKVKDILHKKNYPILNQLKCMVPYALPPNQIFFFKQN